MEGMAALLIELITCLSVIYIGHHMEDGHVSVWP
jgi:hypothetical protein